MAQEVTFFVGAMPAQAYRFEDGTVGIKIINEEINRIPRSGYRITSIKDAAAALNDFVTFELPKHLNEGESAHVAGYLARGHRAPNGFWKRDWERDVVGEILPYGKEAA